MNTFARRVGVATSQVCRVLVERAKRQAWTKVLEMNSLIFMMFFVSCATLFDLQSDANVGADAYVPQEAI